MLVLHGTAEFTEENGRFEKGKRYAFNYAKENRFSVITYQDPVDEELKL